MSDDSTPTVSPNPLAWQKAESESTVPRIKLTIGKTTKAADLTKSLWIKSMMSLCLVSTTNAALSLSCLLMAEAFSHLHEPIQGGKS